MGIPDGRVKPGHGVEGQCAPSIRPSTLKVDFFASAIFPQAPCAALFRLPCGESDRRRKPRAALCRQRGARRESLDRRRVERHSRSACTTNAAMTETSLRTRISVHATSRYPGTTCECGLDLMRRDAITAGIHQFIRSAEVRDVAVIIDGAEVAADKPFATENLRFLFWPPPVAEHQPRVGAMHGDQTFGSRWTAARRRRLTGSIATRRPGCALPTVPGRYGTEGPVEM